MGNRSLAAWSACALGAALLAAGCTKPNAYLCDNGGDCEPGTSSGSSGSSTGPTTPVSTSSTTRGTTTTTSTTGSVTTTGPTTSSSTTGDPTGGTTDGSSSGKGSGSSSSSGASASASTTGSPPSDPYGPCADDLDCSEPGAVCLSSGALSHCAPLCQTDDDCPDALGGSPDGTCIPDFGMVCLLYCNVDGDCPPGQTCSSSYMGMGVCAFEA